LLSKYLSLELLSRSYTICGIEHKNQYHKQDDPIMKREMRDR